MSRFRCLTEPVAGILGYAVLALAYFLIWLCLCMALSLCLTALISLSVDFFSYPIFGYDTFHGSFGAVVLTVLAVPTLLLAVFATAGSLSDYRKHNR